MEEKIKKRFYTTKEVSILLGINKQSVYRNAELMKVACKMVGREENTNTNWLFPVNKIDALIDKMAGNEG